MWQDIDDMKKRESTFPYHTEGPLLFYCPIVNHTKNGGELNMHQIAFLEEGESKTKF